ncbi:MAG: PD40 domain-containing protein [Acidobacteria bacterium]|nr:PD40 domain-containing protein [Acidobacteriota bacterium]
MMRPLRSLVLATVAGCLLLPAAPLLAQTPYVPYFGKNKIKYDHFNWHIYVTDHFEIYYYPEIEPHLERVAGYAESAYQKISADLKHDLPFKIPMILFKTSSEFQQQNIGGELPEGVLAFAEPMRNRMVLPIDEPPDQLYRLITHELTHQFEFDIIPRSLTSAGIPLWVDEGLANYMAGYWNPLDLMQVRDAAISDNVPKMSESNFQALTSRLPYTLGHAAFEFIESKWGKEGLRQFLFSLRKSVIGGGESAYEEALRLEPEEFDEQFERYLKDRFRPFRDKERPNDYGRNLAPRPDRTRYVSIVSIAASPSGDLIAAVAGNRKDQELDIILISAKDGQVVRNVTKGFDKDSGYEYIAQTGGLRGNAVPWISWAPTGDRIAYFARTEKHKTLIVHNIVTGDIDQRIELTTVDAPESPHFSADGRRIAFAGLRGATGDIFVADLDTGALTNVTNDPFADYAPAFSPDGVTMVYVARISGNDKLFRLNTRTGEKVQISFGTHDDQAPRFIDADTLVFASTATDPAAPITPEIAQNGNIFNVWTLNLTNGELRQHTDTVTGNVSPVPLREANDTRLAFVTYYKGEYGIHAILPGEPKAIVASADFGAPGPVIDFQAPLSHTLVTGNMRKKGTFEKMFLDGRPPIGIGVTSGGDFFGGTSISFTDVLGDQQVSVYASSVQQYRTMSASYINQARRLQWATQAFSQTQFFYGLDPRLIAELGLFLDRDDALATRNIKGVTGYAIWPLNRYARVELFGGVSKYNERFADDALEAEAEAQQLARYGTTIFRNGTSYPLGVAFTQETTIFREYGPVAGSAMRASYEFAPKLGESLSRQTAEADLRYYLRLASNGVLALRGRGFKSWGDFPDFFFFGGNSELRGYDYLSFIGQEAFFADAELRVPLIEAMLTPFGVMGGLRGTLFFNIGGAGINAIPFTPWTSKDETIVQLVDISVDPFSGAIRPVFASADLSGFRLVDARASYGIGLQTFALGFPMHFDWSWRTLFNKQYEDLVFFQMGGSEAFRKPKFSFWIGYDF